MSFDRSPIVDQREDDFDRWSTSQCQSCWRLNESEHRWCTDNDVRWSSILRRREHHWSIHVNSTSTCSDGTEWRPTTSTTSISHVPKQRSRSFWESSCEFVRIPTGHTPMPCSTVREVHGRYQPRGNSLIQQIVNSKYSLLVSPSVVWTHAWTADWICPMNLQRSDDRSMSRCCRRKRILPRQTTISTSLGNCCCCRWSL